MSALTGKWFKLFASCIVVKGKSQSLIYDVERTAFYDLPNDFLEILEMSRKMDVEAVKVAFNEQQDDLIDHFFNQFVEAETGFYTNEPESFPDIDMDWKSPNFITNSVIELENLSAFSVADVISRLNALACRAVQIRILKTFSQKELEWLLVTAFDDTRINHIEVLIPFEGMPKNEDLYNLVAAQPRLQRIMIYAAPADTIIEHETERFNGTIIQVRKDIRVETDEIIRPGRFKTNIQLFSEAQGHNLGLNRKVCIDKKGNIKNYLSHDISFGNVNTDAIKNVIETEEYRKKWYISNDKIENCKDCQYRYACVSNSDIKEEKGKYYKADLCDFNPELNTWIKN